MRKLAVLTMALLSCGVHAQDNLLRFEPQSGQYVSPFDNVPVPERIPVVQDEPSKPEEKTPPKVIKREVVKKEVVREAPKKDVKVVVKPEPKKVVEHKSAPVMAKNEKIIEATKKEAVVVPVQNKSVADLPVEIKSIGINPLKTENVAPMPSVATSSVVAVTPVKTVTPDMSTKEVTTNEVTTKNVVTQIKQEDSKVVSVQQVPMSSLDWLYKAAGVLVLLFGVGSLSVYWVKRHAKQGDPAYKDPWFKPVKS